MSDNNMPGCAVLGSGTMGAQIALSLAVGGAHVQLWGRRAESLEPAKQRIEEALDFLIESELLRETNRREVIDRISTTSELQEAATGSDFVIEAIAEDLDAKMELLRMAEAHVRFGTTMSSTTSSLSASKIQTALKAPENFCIAHYAQPAHLMRLVEVVPGKLTSDSAIDSTMNLLRLSGKSPVICPDIPGFLWARIQHAILREFAYLVEKGIASPKDCDTILKQGYAVRLPAMGAFEHADLAGLDLVAGKAAKAVWADLSNATDPESTVLGSLKAQGHTGMRSGRGFYEWSADEVSQFLRSRDEEIVRRAKIDPASPLEGRLPD